MTTGQAGQRPRQNGQTGPLRQDAAERYARLAERFVALADTLVDDYDVVDLLDQLVQSYVELLDVSQVGLMLVDQEGHLSLVASSSEETRLLELLQIQTEEGPCSQCVRERRAVTVPDIAASRDQWPQFTTAAAEAGFESVHAVPLRLREHPESGARAWPAYPLVPGTTYVNAGFWGTVEVPLGTPDGQLNREVERIVTTLGGHKSLYSDAYYDEATFASLYNTPHLDEIRRSTDPEGRLTRLYDKAVRRA